MMNRIEFSPIRILLWLFLLSFSLLLTGCGRNGEQEKATVPGQILRFYTWKSDQPKVWDQIVTMFESEHPSIKVRREIGPNSSTALHDLLTQKLKNKSRDLDVFFMDVVWTAEFAAAGWTIPLDEWFPKSAQSQFLTNTIEANTYKGRIYGIPLFIDSGMLYYRKDLLEMYGFKPPETWPEMVRQAEFITVREPGLYGYSAQFKQYEGLICNMMEFIASNRGKLINSRTGHPAIAELSALEAVRFVRDKIIGKIAPLGVLTYEEPESIALFVQGRAVFHRNWPYAWEVANNPDISKIAGKVGVTKLPHFPGSESHAALGGWQLGISAYSENREMAWTFVQFVTSSRIQKLLSLKAGLAPTRIALYDDPDTLKASPQFREMKPVFISAVPRPISPLYPSLSGMMQRYFSTAISDRHSDIPKEARMTVDAMEKVLAIEP
jgi:multiple sugar transport system substrate-binding protein